MKNLYLRSLLFIGLLIGFSFVGISAQKLQQNPNNPKNNLRQHKLLQALGLSKEQIQQIRRINADKKMQMGEAQMRLRQATRKLDQAIYADNANDEEVQNRLREVQTAQSEIIKIRFSTEFEVRKILNAEQLNKFRQIRQQFMERMNDADNPLPQNETQNPPLDKRRFQKRRNN